MSKIVRIPRLVSLLGKTDAKDCGEPGSRKYLISRCFSQSGGHRSGPGNGSRLQFAMEISKPMKTNNFPQLHFATGMQIEMLIGPRVILMATMTGLDFGSLNA